VYLRGIRTVLYRYNQLWHGIFEPPTKKMRKSDEERLKTREVARAKTYRRPDMRDREVELSRPDPDLSSVANRAQSSD